MAKALSSSSDARLLDVSDGHDDDVNGSFMFSSAERSFLQKACFFLLRFIK